MFNFRLTPIEMITPWESHDKLYLLWFGLTYGCYGLHVGDAELFRYSQEFITAGNFRNDCDPYVDYQVARFWEDLVDILPRILGPIPDTIAEKIVAPNKFAWHRRAYDWMEAREDSDSTADDVYDKATEWLGKRNLSSMHLTHSPEIWFWSDGSYIHVEWDNREQEKDGIRVWDAQMGSWSLPVADFLDEVRKFNSDLMQVMQLRLDQLGTYWNRPEIIIDIPQLIAEQASRATYLERILTKAIPTEDWAGILKAVARIEADTTM